VTVLLTFVPFSRMAEQVAKWKFKQYWSCKVLELLQTTYHYYSEPDPALQKVSKQVSIIEVL